MGILAIKAAKLASVLAALAAVHAASPDLQTLLVVAGFLSAVLVWVALQVRDYKPNRRLRADNSELRSENDNLRRLLDDSAAQQRELEKSRDFDKALAVVMKEIAEVRAQATSEHRAILEELQESRKTWATFHQQLASLTSAIQVVASGMLSAGPPTIPQQERSTG